MIRIFSSHGSNITFKEEFTQVLIKQFWDRYQIAIGVSVFVPFVVYVLAINVFFSNYLINMSDSKTPTFYTLKILSYFFTLLFSVVEIA